MTRRTFLIPLFAAAFILAPSELSGQAIPLSGPFEVSPRSYGSNEPGRYTTRLPAAAALADGSFAVAWAEDLEILPPGEPSVPFFDLYARKIGENGTPGRLVRVDRGGLESVETERRPLFPDLAADGQGGFVLAWERWRFQGSDILYQTVPSGDFVHRGGRLLHRPKAGRQDRSPAVAANAAGAWVMAWSVWNDPNGVSTSLGIRAFQASGEPATPEIRIATSDPDVALVRPRVAMQEDGSFMVIWGNFASFASGRIQKLQGRSFAADGTPRTPVLQLGQGMNVWEIVSGDPARGEFLVAWQTDSVGGPLIRLRRYGPEGQRLGTRVLAHERGLRNWSLTSNHHGDLAFLWVNTSGDVNIRLLDSRGVPRGAPFLVTQLSDNPWIGDLAIGDTGKILAVWVSPADTTTPGGATHKPVLGRLWEVQD